METDAVIVGGGIGGAVLALALAQRGWTVQILEREAEPLRVVRPELWWPATPAALDRLGPGAAIRAAAMAPIRGFKVLRGEQAGFEITAADLDAAGLSPVSTDASRTRALIMEAAVATGRVGLARGATVMALIREDGRVIGARARSAEGEIEVRGRLLVGDDGVRSVVREQLGIAIDLRTFPLEFAAWGAPRPPDLPADEGRAWLNPAALREGVFAGVFLPLPGDRIVSALGIPTGTWERRYDGAPERFWSDFAALTPVARWARERLEFPRDFPHLRRPYGHAERYVADGAAILGDAAHPMSPAGGQGANAAIWDALTLAEVADTALRADDVSAARLAAYERRRRAANARSLSFTEFGGRRLGLAKSIPGMARLALLLLRWVNRSAAMKQRLLRRTATAFLSE